MSELLVACCPYVAGGLFLLLCVVVDRVGGLLVFAEPVPASSHVALAIPDNEVDLIPPAPKS